MEREEEGRKETKTMKNIGGKKIKQSK